MFEKPLYQAPEGEVDPTEDIALEITVTTEDEEAQLAELDAMIAEAVPFEANLAEFMEEDDLQAMGEDLLEAVENDKQSRAEWEETYKDGLELLGLKIDDRTEPWDGACGVHHPVLAEAVMKFQAETIVETFPAQGPVKTQILGETNREKEEAAARVREDMNYLLTNKMPEFRAEHERLLWHLPIAGSAFKKIYYHPTLGRPMAEMVPAEDFIVSYGASSLRTAQRYTHRMRRTQNELRKLQVSGFYRDCDLEPYDNGDPHSDDVDEAKDNLNGWEDSQDDRPLLYEIHCDYDVPGFEDRDEMGEETGIELPYVVTIHADSGKVMSVYRNWEETDQSQEKRVHFSHYTYIPGFGFYGLGLIHLIGGFAKGATSILRQLVDAGTLSNLPGGFRTRGLRIKGGDTPIAPGEFRDVDVPTGSIKENIMSLPYKEPSTVLAGLLDKIVNEARRFAAVSDVNVADLQPNAPVGSTLAVLERTLKPMTAIQARIHAAMMTEFGILKEIVSEYAPDDYEYDAVGRQVARRMDYMMTDVIPVSDPNASTMSQRIAQYQAAHQLAQSAPHLYDQPLLHRQMIQTLGLKDSEKLVPNKEDIPPMDPVAENMAVLMGKPIKVYAHQDHKAHIQAHMAFGQDPKIQAMLKQQGPGAQAKMMAGFDHINEHLAHMYRAEMEETLGVPIPVVDSEEKQSLPAEAEVALSRLVAQASGKLLNKHAQEEQAKENQKKAEDPLIQMQQRELAIKEADQRRKEQKDKLDHDAKMVQSIIEAARMDASQQAQGMKMGTDIVRDVLKASSDLRGKGADIGSRLSAQQTRAAQPAPQTGPTQPSNEPEK